MNFIVTGHMSRKGAGVNPRTRDHSQDQLMSWDEIHNQDFRSRLGNIWCRHADVNTPATFRRRVRSWQLGIILQTWP